MTTTSCIWLAGAAAGFVATGCVVAGTVAGASGPVEAGSVDGAMLRACRLCCWRLRRLG